MTVAPLRQRTVRESVSPQEWQARVHLAACYRLMAHDGVRDLTYNHLSARVPGEPDKLILKSRTMMFEEVTASNLEKFDFDGNPFQDSPRLAGGGYVIHAGILRARPDINAVFHTHTAANVGVSAQKRGLMRLSQHSLYLYGRLAYHEFGGFEFNVEQRDPLIASLDGKRIAILRNHGALVCGRTIAEAFVDHHFLEFACRAQIAALAGGAEVTEIPIDISTYGAQQVQSYTDNPGAKDWEACLRLATRLDPSFAE